jgi:hypothetical protein
MTKANAVHLMLGGVEQATISRTSLIHQSSMFDESFRSHSAERQLPIPVGSESNAVA